MLIAITVSIMVPSSILTCLCSILSFLHCIPKSFSRHIARNNVLTRFRIRRVFTNFVKVFQQHTVGEGKLGLQEVVCKYISTLERLVPNFGIETFPVFNLDLRADGDSSGSYLNASRTQAPSAETVNAQPTYEIRVSGSTGIWWRKTSALCVSWWSAYLTFVFANRTVLLNSSHFPGECLYS